MPKPQSDWSRVLAVAAFALTLAGLLWTAAEREATQDARIRQLEETQKFLHGEFAMPKGGKE